MQIVDGHAHACGMLLNTECTIKYMRENNICKIILSGGEPNSKKVYKLPYLAKIFKSSKLLYLDNKLTAMIVSISKMNRYLDQENIKVALMAEKCPEYIMNTYWINPLEENCIDKMKDFYYRYSFCMIKLHQCWTKFDVEDTKVINIIKWAEHNRIPVFIHLKSKNQVKKFILLTKEYPKVAFILAHLIGIEEFDNTIGENIYFDISCPLLHSVKMLKRAFDFFGSERILLGSDAPYGADNIKLAISQMHEAGLDDNDIELVCSKNILRLLAKGSGTLEKYGI